MRTDVGIKSYGMIDTLPFTFGADTSSSELEGIEGRLRSLSEEPGFQCLIDRPQHEKDVSGLLEDLRESIFRYQVCSCGDAFYNANEDRRWRDKHNFATKNSAR